jgi:tripartite-type tricarboxylate transporter receptor subunit TctC
MGKAVEKNLGKAWVINNLPGASGANAWNYSAKADPNGYTLLGISSTIITAPILNEMSVGYKNFEPVAMMFTDPMVLFVPADSSIKSIKDLVDAAKAAPGKLKFAGGTPGELGFVAGRELMNAAGFEMGLVPFEGGGDAAVTVLGGHLDGGIGEYAEIASNVEAGKLRIIGSFNKMPKLTEIETVAEAGYPEVKIEKLRGVLAPKGTPQEVIDIIAAAMKKALDDPDFKTYYEKSNLIPSFLTGADFAKLMDAQDAQIRASVAK